METKIRRQLKNIYSNIEINYKFLLEIFKKYNLQLFIVLTLFFSISSLFELPKSFAIVFILLPLPFLIIYSSNLLSYLKHKQFKGATHFEPMNLLNRELLLLWFTFLYFLYFLVIFSLPSLFKNLFILINNLYIWI